MSARYLLRRLAQVVPAVAAIVIVAFVVIHTAPGDPVVALAGANGDAAYYAFIRAKFGLDRPLPEQFMLYAAHVARGDLGMSFVHGRPVAAVVLERVPATVLLMSSALVFATAAGVLLGVVAARDADRSLDLGVRATALLGYAAPSFWLAQLAALTLALGTGLFPVHGMTDARRAWTGWGYAADVLITSRCPRWCWPPTRWRSRRASSAQECSKRWRPTTSAPRAPRGCARGRWFTTPCATPSCPW
jgi:peptide/nickel transport system permease protein